MKELNSSFFKLLFKSKQLKVFFEIAFKRKINIKVELKFFKQFFFAVFMFNFYF